jgi:hypothetical protein
LLRERKAPQKLPQAFDADVANDAAANEVCTQAAKRPVIASIAGVSGIAHRNPCDRIMDGLIESTLPRLTRRCMHQPAHPVTLVAQQPTANGGSIYVEDLRDFAE